MLALILGVSIYSMAGLVMSEARVLGSVTMIAGEWLPLVIPLVAGVVGAGMLAEDRRQRQVALVLARGISRRQYLLAKVAAMMTSSGLVTLLGLGLFYVAAVIFLPMGPWTRQPYPTFPGPVPELFQHNPLLNDLLMIAITTCAASVLALVGLLTGTLVPNEYVAMAAPFLLVILTAFGMQGIDIINPFVYLDLQSHYARMAPLGGLYYRGFVYWAAAGALLVTASFVIFLRAELD